MSNIWSDNLNEKGFTTDCFDPELQSVKKDRKNDSTTTLQLFYVKKNLLCKL